MRTYCGRVGRPAENQALASLHCLSLFFLHQIVANTLTAAFDLAVSLGATSVAMPTLATGYGPMTIDAFARAFADSVLGRFPIETVTIVVRSDENAGIINSVLAAET